MTTLESLFTDYSTSGKEAMGGHLHRLRELASQCTDCAEFGVAHGASTVALLLGCKGTVHSYDIAKDKAHETIQVLAGDRWRLHYQSSHAVTLPPVELLFVDSEHNYPHIKKELDMHGNVPSKFLVFHDTVTFGTVGYMYPKIRVPGMGILRAIDEFVTANKHWVAQTHYLDHNGMLVLARR
jgi:hypothetical protein